MASNAHQVPAIPGKTTNPKPVKTTRKASTVIVWMAAIRSLTGVTSFLAPHLFQRLMFLDAQAGNNTIMPRAFGAREAALGTVTYLAYKTFVASPTLSSLGNENEHDRLDEERKASLEKVLIWANIFVDSSDAIACGLAWMAGAEGEVATAAFLGPSAVFAAMLGVLGWRSLF